MPTSETVPTPAPNHSAPPSPLFSAPAGWLARGSHRKLANLWPLIESGAEIKRPKRPNFNSRRPSLQLPAPGPHLGPLRPASWPVARAQPASLFGNRRASQDRDGRWSLEASFAMDSVALWQDNQFLVLLARPSSEQLCLGRARASKSGAQFKFQSCKSTNQRESPSFGDDFSPQA